MDRSLVRASKFLSLVLRHRPEEVGIALDEAGWVDVGVLLDACGRAGVSLDRPTLERVVAENDKQRFAFSDDGRRIRASQGHSVRVELGLQPQTPPKVLYHGTASKSVEAIRREGLRRGRRTHVHLSPDERTAEGVGGRHGRPVVLRVEAGRMHAEGHAFYRSENGFWLAEAVAAEFIVFPEDA